MLAFPNVGWAVETSTSTSSSSWSAASASNTSSSASSQATTSTSTSSDASGWYENAAPVSEEELSELQKRVEDSAKAYDEAVQAVEDISEQVEANEKLLEETADKLQAQKGRSAQAMETMYKMRRGGYGIAGMILNSMSMEEFLTTWQYLDSIEQHNYSEIERYADLKRSYEETRSILEQQKAAAEQREKEAADALAQAQAAREEAQNRAARAAQEEQARLAAAGVDTSAVDWTVGKDAFGIDVYLAGSPMAGTGKAFAEAAWRYGVDPRWSPAISNTESTKGRFIPGGYNAWGWTNGQGGYRTFASWEDGINQHVAYLARSYGYTITLEHAQKYCPPTYQAWYATTLSQMQTI